MGSYRLLLAIAVMLSHVWGGFLGHNQGVAAVVSFFLLSGFVMTALIRRNYNSIDRVGMFYVDRVMRLFPQFLFYLVATIILFKVAHPVSPFLSGLTIFKVLLNFLMLPLGFFMYGLVDALLIPPSWSLGLELTFYLAIPFILIYRLEKYAFAISVVIFMLAYFSVINTDTFGYRLLPGTLFIFLCGSFLYKLESTKRKATLIGSFIIAAIMFEAVRKVPSLQVFFNYEVLIGLLIGLPVVAVLSRYKSGLVDETLGNISYGVFLNHNFVMWTARCMGMDTGKPGSIVLLILVSIMLAWVTYMLIERPVIHYRRKLRRKADGNAALLPQAI
ncbi:acyltransferase family protein [Silvimonas amylolytica]|uniref:acyltransferase family protein n=1 Tax=Silvimonas amylolytica TaxID=449663 RepID=UPI001669446E|nr:acyltransferase [Silvimonas amylolytica]